MRDRVELEKLVRFLEENTEFLQEHPSCSYIIPLVVAKLEKNRVTELPEASVDNFRDYLAHVWNDSTSAISTIVPVSLQLEIVTKIGELVREFAKLIKEHNMAESHKSLGESIDKLKADWEKSCHDLVTRVQTAIWEYKRPVGKLCEHEISCWSKIEWKNDLIKLIGKYDLMNESKEPSYLLKSGYRSFFFFSSADLTYPDIWWEFCRILSEFMNKKVDPFMAEMLKDDATLEYLAQRYSQHGLKDIVELVPVTKVNGENLGAPTLMAGLAHLGFSQRDLAPQSCFGIERLRGRKPEEEMLIVMLDDVSSRGAGISQSIERLKAASHIRPVLGLLIVDRLREEISHAGGITVLSMINRNELVQSRIWVPEMLLASLENPLWAGLSLLTDSIKEICTFADEKDQYETFQEKFSLLLEDAFDITEHSGKTRVLNIDLDFPKKALETYLTNILLICWNTLIPASFTINEPVQFLNIVLEFEQSSKIVLDSFSILFSRELERFVEDESEFLEHQDIMHRLFVVHNENLIAEIKNKYQEYQKLHMRKVFELYADNELKELVEDAMRKSKERWKRYGCLEYYERNEDKMRQELFEVYKGFNMVFGKQQKASASPQ